MKQLSIVTVLVALTGAVLAGCGSSNKSNNASTTPSTPATTTPAGGATSAKTVAVDIKDIKYIPQNVTVKVGQTIKWHNSDALAHTVTSKSGAKFDSGTMNANQDFQFKPTKAGTINYVCLIHPGQTGTITVTK